MTSLLADIESSLGINYQAARLEPLTHPLLSKHQLSLYIKRDDLIHPIISGNKWRKLKYNLLQAIEQGQTHIVSMGGAWSNHLHALAYIGQQLNIKTTGLVRGETSHYESPTLADMRNWGMQIEFVERREFRELRKCKAADAGPAQRYQAYWIPEGGATPLALQGVAELKQEVDIAYDTLALACGSGTTLAGLVPVDKESHRVIGIASLKGAAFLQQDINDLLQRAHINAAVPANGWSLMHDYHCGGFARTNQELERFMQTFEQQTTVPLDPVYTGKLMYGLFDLIETGVIKNGEIVIAIHSGGLQGKRGQVR